MQQTSVFKNLSFRSPHYAFQVKPPLWESFSKTSVFSGVITVLVWTEGENASKKMCFQIKNGAKFKTR